MVFWVKFDRFLSFLAIEKSRRFVKISVPFYWFLTQKWLIGIYRKTGPTKSTVLGPRPPPWEIVKIYRFLCFFMVLGAFNRAGKTVTKIGIYALPPQKWCFYGDYIKLGREVMSEAVLSLFLFPFGV
jgi:hypothetical protein